MSQDSNISIAMCTYNGGSFLPEQLASIAAQTRLPDELVICDDGSTDSTPEIIAEFARKVTFPVRFFPNPHNLGSTKNFEQAMGLCTGELIALCDQDDIWMPEKLARQAEIMELDPELGGVFSDADLINDRSQLLGRTLWSAPRFTKRKQKKFRSGLAQSVLLERNVAWGATLMIRSSLLTLIGDIPQSWGHDNWIAWTLVLYSKLDFTSERLIKYRIHSNQQTAIKDLFDPRKFTLGERLLTAKREEPAKQLARAAEFQILYERLATSQNEKNQAALPGIERAIRFFSDCGNPYTSYASKLMIILKNTWNYQRFENGWKSMVRDIVLVFVKLGGSASVAGTELRDPAHRG